MIFTKNFQAVNKIEKMHEYSINIKFTGSQVAEMMHYDGLEMVAEHSGDANFMTEKGMTPHGMKVCVRQMCNANMGQTSERS